MPAKRTSIAVAMDCSNGGGTRSMGIEEIHRWTYRLGNEGNRHTVILNSQNFPAARAIERVRHYNVHPHCTIFRGRYYNDS